MNKSTYGAIAAALLWMPVSAFAQYVPGTPAPAVPLPAELTDTKPVDESLWNKLKAPYNSAWGSTDLHYSSKNVPTQGVSKSPVAKVKAWKGERVNLLALLYTTVGAPDVTPRVSELKGPGNAVIPAEDVTTGFLHYVMTDQINHDGLTACGNRPDHSLYDSLMVADAIDPRPVADIAPRTTRPLWVSVDVPRDATPGVYRATLSFGDDKKFKPLSIEISVGRNALPSGHDRKFALDLWQHPYSVARVYNVELWSPEHFAAMEETFRPLAEMGQKCITATVTHAPWGGQTEDHFDSMVSRTRELDGSWSYNYDVFDQWVEFMMGLGIDGQINCYSLIPWKMSFPYYDRASNTMKTIETSVGTPEFNDYWLPFLKDFASHLKEKGWFDITTIAMDERALSDMKKGIALIREADPDYKIALAGNYHPEIEPDLYDYCIALAQTFPDDVLADRKNRGVKSTVYTCCAEGFPNTFTCSEPAEAEWLPIYAASKDFDGYLRWAFNSWVANPLSDSRFRSWAAGDCYLIYPGGRSSVRLEKLNEGIQDFEKIMILREKYAGNPAKLAKINKMLEKFVVKDLPSTPASATLPQVRELLNTL